MKRNKTIEMGALRIFAIVAESETLTQAALRLGISQSAVSQAIKLIEENAEALLIVRRSRPIKLTQSGIILREYADRILSDTGRMMNDVKLAADGQLSNLNVGMIDSFGDSLGLQFITKIKPFVAKVSLQTGLHTSLSESLRNRNIDILIRADPLELETNLNRHALIRDPFLVIAPKDAGGDVTPDIQHLASKLPFIHYSPNSPIGAQTDLIARRLGVELNTHYELDSTQTLIRFVRANHGWAIISALCMVRYPQLLEDIQILDLNGGANARYISLFCRKNEYADLPEKFAAISRQIFTQEVSPRLKEIAPWLAKQAYSIDRLPTF
ncbi:MAG: DNA-binding transcriptional LysR family regulator [Arenicella sp.]|jgi:DNA-binding transcriptional LysR family regulator